MIEIGWCAPDAPYMHVHGAPISMEVEIIKAMDAIEKSYGEIQLGSSVEAMLRTIGKNYAQLRG